MSLSGVLAYFNKSLVSSYHFYAVFKGNRWLPSLSFWIFVCSLSFVITVKEEQPVFSMSNAMSQSPLINVRSQSQSIPLHFSLLSALWAHSCSNPPSLPWDILSSPFAKLQGRISFNVSIVLISLCHSPQIIRIANSL